MTHRTHAEIAAIRAAHNAGKTFKQLANELGVSPARIAQIYHKVDRPERKELTPTESALKSLKIKVAPHMMEKRAEACIKFLQALGYTVTAPHAPHRFL